jgi:hypothetical protein
VTSTDSAEAPTSSLKFTGAGAAPAGVTSLTVVLLNPGLDALI